ncbi:MAG: IS66 family transposase [Saprospiraceae bacterium]|nr:IS66 family transposase [Saprospiraceae bacterium]
MSKDEIIAQKDDVISTLSIENAQLKFRLSQLERLIFGKKSERWISDNIVDPEQLLLFTHEAAEDISPAKEEISYTRSKPKKAHPGRQALPDHLPVEEVVIEPEEDVTGMTRIGEEVTDTLDYKAASLTIIRTIRPKYARPNGEGVVIGKLPVRPIEKGIAEAGLLAHVVVSKFVDHMPFYRQIQRFQRDFKLSLSESTINDWFVSVCTLMKPLHDELLRSVFSSDYIQVDESPIRVLDKDKAGSTHRGQQWVYHSPALKRVAFQYRKGRGMHGPKEMLSTYRGHIQCDGYKVYDGMARNNPSMILLGCLAHTRRKYFDAEKIDPRVSKPLKLIQQLYRIERELRSSSLSADQYTQARQKQMRPIFDEWKKWMEENEQSILPKSAVGKAIVYTLHQWAKLERILEDSRFLLDNNLIENLIRPLALGKKNYLFAGSHPAGERIAMMYSFFGTCKLCDINPYEWLQDTLIRLPQWPMNRIGELLPQPKD